MRGIINTCLTIFVLASALTATHSALAESKRPYSTSYDFKKAKENKETQTGYRDVASASKQLKSEVASWELRTAPIAFLIKWITLDVSRRLTENFSLGPSVILYNSPKGEPGGMLAPAFNGHAFGLNTMYYFGSVARDTWYTSFHAYYNDFSSYAHGFRVGDVTEVNGFKSNAALGYQWRWSNLTLLTGGGVEYQRHHEKRIRTDANGSPSTTPSKNTFLLPFVEFKVGIEL